MDGNRAAFHAFMCSPVPIHVFYVLCWASMSFMSIPGGFHALMSSPLRVRYTVLVQ